MTIIHTQRSRSTPPLPLPPGGPLSYSLTVTVFAGLFQPVINGKMEILLLTAAQTLFSYRGTCTKAKTTTSRNWSFPYLLCSAGLYCAAVCHGVQYGAAVTRKTGIELLYILYPHFLPGFGMSVTATHESCHQSFM